MREDFHQKDGHSSDLDQKRSGILLMIADHKIFKFGESGHPVFRATRPLSRGTPTLSTEDPAQYLLQKNQQRVERLSQQNRVTQICTDAGFLTTVEVGQYFMTKDTEEFSQFTEPVTCREYTLPRDEKSFDRKVGFEGTPKMGPC